MFRYHVKIMTVTFFSFTGMIPERKEEVTIFMADKRERNEQSEIMIKIGYCIYTEICTTVHESRDNS